jgi:hypothetical protein
MSIPLRRDFFFPAISSQFETPKKQSVKMTVVYNLIINRKAGAAIPGSSAHQLHETFPPEFYLT